jgi:hypothetical protein
MMVMLGKAPLIVWPLLGVLLWVGLRRTRPTISKLRTLLIVPLIILAISIKRMAALSLDEVSLLSWLGALIIGGAIGWLMMRGTPVRADHQNKLIGLPGSWVTLCSLLIIFFSRYYFSALFAAQPALRADAAYVIASVSLLGFFLGFFTGRQIGHYHQYRKTATTDLSSGAPDK